MPRTTITNTTLDAALAAVPAPYGPLTRTGSGTDLTADPTVSPNSHLRFKVKSTTSQLVFEISYEQLLNTVVRDDIIKEAHGARAVLYDLKAFIDIMDAAMTGIDPLTVNSEFLSLAMQAFSYSIPLMNQSESFGMLDSRPYSPVTASYSTTGAGASRTFTNTSLGRVLFRLWTFGDGTYSTEVSPVKTWAVDGTYVVRLMNFGVNGLVTATTSPVIDVP